MNRFTQFAIKLRLNLLIRPNLSTPCLKYHKYSRVLFTASDNLDYMITELGTIIRKRERIPPANIDAIVNCISANTSEEQSIILLQSCHNARHEPNQALLITRIWDELRQHKHLLNYENQKTMLKHFSFHGNVAEAQTYFDQLTQTGYRHNSFTYQHLIAAYARAGNLAKVDEIIGVVEGKKLLITDKICNLRLQCLLLNGDVSGAHNEWDNMDIKGFSIDKYSLRAFAKHYAQIGDMENLLLIITRCKNELAQEAGWLISMAINDIASNGLVDQIDSLVEMLRPTLELDFTFENAISHFVQRGNATLLPKIFQSIDIDKVAMAKYLINEIVMQSIEADQVNEIWQQLTSMDITIGNNFDVYSSGYASESIELIEAVHQHMHLNGIEFEYRHFMQLLQISRKNSVDDMLTTLRNICSKYNYIPTSSIVRDRILTHFNWKEDPKAALAQVQSALPPQHRHRANYAIINLLLTENDMWLAYEIAASDVTALDTLEAPLIEAYHNTRDIKCLVSFIRLMYDRILRSGYGKADALDKQNAFIENIIQSIIFDARATVDTNIAFLSALFESGFYISNFFAAHVTRELHAGDEIKYLLEKLAKQADDLKSALQIFQGDYETMTSDQIVTALKVQKLYSQRTMLGQVNLFRAYMREGNEKGIESLLSDDNFKLNAAHHSLLIDFYIKRREFEKALEWMKHAYKNDESFTLNALRTVEIIKLLTDHVRTKQDVNFCYSDEDNNTDNAKLFFFEQLFIDQIKGTQKNSRVANFVMDLIGEIIMVHLKQSNLEKAVMVFVRMTQMYGILAARNILLKQLIEENETGLLQRVLDAIKCCQGEDQTNIDLAFAYVECGQDKEAKTIFQRTSSSGVSIAIARKSRWYYQRNQIDTLETLLQATVGLACDRTVIYNMLLEMYVERNGIDQARELHDTYLREESELPTKAFMAMFETLVKTNK